MVDGIEAWLRAALVDYAAGFGEQVELVDPRGELTAALIRFGSHPQAIEAWGTLDRDLRGMSEEMRRLVAFDVFWVVERAFTDRETLSWASPDDADHYGRDVAHAIDGLLGVDPHLFERACAKGEIGRAVDDYLATHGTWVPYVAGRAEYADMLRSALLGLRKDVHWWVEANADEAKTAYALTHRQTTVRELNELLLQHLGQSPASVVAGLANATFPKLAPLVANEVAALLVRGSNRLGVSGEPGRDLVY